MPELMGKWYTGTPAVEDIGGSQNLRGPGPSTSANYVQ